MSDTSPSLIAATIASAAAVAGVVAARHRFMIIDVMGESMSPSLAHGDRLLVRRTQRLRVGAIVVAHHQQGGRRAAVAGSPASTWLVKRLAALPGDTVPELVAPAVGHSRQVPAGMTVLLGDHPNSVDSRLWGFVPLRDIEGVAITRLRRNVT
ncbi:hypothetical protein E1193_01160 [Micromonospora sp. KC606]|uniref:S26 family signal peptidase n=1 Tax=Micromonospora sp. KC606 TaxID=2530379 RepID=UPI001044A35C|nr:S26 family signal peptidase [Micromonospora sp. KC606]TDC85941.1 hypothetical protein E1193_01160 [Micromonospora sp. KC606]